MGRRALRKVDPSLELSRYFKTFDDLPSPWDQAALFERPRPLQIDVGCGKGLFLRSVAPREPEVNFLGIEVARKYARFTAAAMAKRELTNAVCVHGDALRIFAELLPDESVSAVHVYFPDPWWKKRHKKRRVMRPSFVRDVERTLEPGGSLHFWTDVEEYFQAGLEVVGAETRLNGPLPVPEQPAEHDLAYRTHFERRTRLHDEAVHRAEFRKGSSGGCG